MKTKTQNKLTARYRWRLLSVITVLLLLGTHIRAQVTIGAGEPPQDFSILEVVSNGIGGLRLPHLTNDQRNAITSHASFTGDKAELGQGLAIFNLDTKCYEYWNNKRWVSLCEGTSLMTISPEPCSNVAANGTGCDEDFTITDPDCENGPFSFTIVGGSDYASLIDVDEAAGTFRISFEANNSIKARSVIVRVTSSCTGLFKDFLFTQLGQNCDPSLGTAPAITSVPSGKNISFCAGGAIYLSVPVDTPNLDELIWTRNNVEVARGVNNIAVTQAGVYDVWMGIIGCNQLIGNAVTVTRDGAGAPLPVNIVVVGNNGLVCDANGITKLVALKASAGTVRWFKDGILQALSSPDNEIEAGVGEWFAVVNDGSCWSTPSASVTVSIDPNAGTSLIEPVVEKNGSFCAGGSVQLRVSDASYNASYTYTWYENNTILGTGRDCLYRVPTGTGSVVIRCRATLGGSCATEAISSETITTGTIPSRPVITGDKQLCSGTATLNAVPVGVGAFTYRWYKDGELYATTQSITITQGGEYSVTVTSDGGTGCTSQAASITISDISSAIPTVTLNRSAESPNQGDIVTYAATINFTPATAYIWTIANATLQSGGGNSANAVVKFDNTGAASVKVEVSNACGIGSAIHTVANVQQDCVNPLTVSPSGSTSLTAIVGEGITLGPVSATFASGSPTASYQWYSNISASSMGGTGITGATNNTYIASHNSTGTYYYYCEVKNVSCNSTTIPSGLYTVTVSDPASNPIGVGTFSGKTCFDVVETNEGGSCATLEGRASQKADFSKTATNTQTYTFTTSGSVSKIRFYAVDQTGLVIESITPGNSSWETGTNLSGTYTVTVKYRTSLNNDQSQGGAGGLDRDNALKATLYVVYNDGATGAGSDKRLELKVSVQDCTCCPGYLAIGGEYIKNYSGYIPIAADGANWDAIIPYFTATGNDVCFYKDLGPYATWNDVINNDKCNTDNAYVGADFRSMGWRLPTLAELAALQSINKNLSSQPTSISGTANFGNDYWSSDELNASSAEAWRFSKATAGYRAKTGKRYVRCVRSF